MELIAVVVFFGDILVCDKLYVRRLQVVGMVSFDTFVDLDLVVSEYCLFGTCILFVLGVIFAFCCGLWNREVVFDMKL